MNKSSSSTTPIHSVVVVESRAALPSSWLRPRGDVIVLSEIESEEPEAFAQRVIRAIVELTKSAPLTEVRLFTAQDRTETRLRARSRIARALLAAMSSVPAARITFVAKHDHSAQHDLFALADTVRTEASANVSVCLNFQGAR